MSDSDAWAEHYQTVQICPVEGDPDGRLTNTLIRRLSGSGLWRCTSCRAELSLRAKIICCDQRYIGYQLDRVRCLDEKGKAMGSPLGKEVDRLLPNEGRHRLSLEIQLIDTRSGKTVYGPTSVTAEVDFDYNPLTTDTRLSVFSLGEFVNVDQARDIACGPLYDRLAEKVIDLLSW